MRNRAADQDLVARMQAGDSSAVADLDARYGRQIHLLAMRYVRNKEDAEEIAQDVLLKVFRKIGAFRGDAALSSWIYRITFNTAMSRLRRGSLPQRTVSSPRSVEEMPVAPRREIADWSSLADERVMRQELRARLVDALQELPTIYRLPVMLRDLQGLSTEEASTVLGVKTQTLKSRLHRGRLILRDHLSEFADGVTLHRAA